ncbi:MAG: hypothetical protein KAV00_08970 [Phycisphaerae bacterium]|nr:hypothetical protein [Phycisphaerae bacterium]
MKANDLPRKGKHTIRPRQKQILTPSADDLAMIDLYWNPPSHSAPVP